MALHQSRGVFVSLAHLTLFHPIGDELAGRVAKVRVENQRSFQGSNRSVEHLRAAASVMRVIVIARAQRAPRWSVSGIETDRTLQHGDGFSVRCGIVGQ